MSSTKHPPEWKICLVKKYLSGEGSYNFLAEANELIDRYIHFYNHERIQLKTGVAPLALRHSA